uniref:Pre-rRNA-processing protein TSR2 homolog n=1 Tax=Clastoptera arizonana TaxID=38151 RepID=A0A1B6DBK4_9HEMI
MESTSFQEYVGIVFNNWTALKLAIEHGMGGPPTVLEMKVNKIIDNISNLLVSGSEWEDVADTLANLMDDEFSTIIEDNSSDEVGFQLFQLFQLYSAGNHQEILASISHLPITTPINIRRTEVQALQKPPEEVQPQNSNNVMQLEEDSDWTIVKRR